MNRVFAVLKYTAMKKKLLMSIYCRVTRTKNELLVEKCLSDWLQLYRQRAGKKAIKDLGTSLYRERTYQKYLTIWVQKLRTRLKKKYLLTVVAPQVMSSHARTY